MLFNMHGRYRAVRIPHSHADPVLPLKSALSVQFLLPSHGQKKQTTDTILSPYTVLILSLLISPTQSHSVSNAGVEGIDPVDNY